MNKIVKLALIVLVVMVLLIAGGSFYLVKNGQSILNSSKPFLETKLAAILKTPVKLGTLKLQVFPNAIVDVESLTIGQTDKSAGLTVKEIKLDVAIFELLKKKLLINELSVNNPEIKIIKSKSGIVIDGLPVSEKKVAPATEVVNSEAQPKQAVTEIPGGIEIGLEHFVLSNAKIELIDQVSNKKFVITPLTVAAVVKLVGSTAQLLNLQLDSEIAGITKISVASDEIKFDLKNQQLTLPALVAKVLDADFKINTDFNLPTLAGLTKISGANLNLKKVAEALTAFTPALKAMNLEGGVSPELQLAVNGLKDIKAYGTVKLKEIAAQFGTIALSKLAADLKINANLKEQLVSSDNLNLLIGSAPVSVAFNAGLFGADAKLEQAAIKLFSGSVAANAGFNLQSQAFTTVAKASQLDLGQAYQALPMPILQTFTGNLNSLNLKASGALGKNLTSSLTAQGDLLLTNGMLKGVNLPAKVLSVINNLPFIAGSLLDVVPDSLRGEVNGEDTAIKQLNANYNLSNSNLQLSSVSLVSTIFNLTANGRIGLDQSLDLNAEIIFTPAFSQALAAKTKEVARILDSNNQLVLPIIIKGKGTKVIIIPNLKRLLELAASRAVKDKVQEKVKEKLGEKAGDLLNKFGF